MKYICSYYQLSITCVVVYTFIRIHVHVQLYIAFRKNVCYPFILVSWNLKIEVPDNSSSRIIRPNSDFPLRDELTDVYCIFLLQSLVIMHCMDMRDRASTKIIILDLQQNNWRYEYLIAINTMDAFINDAILIFRCKWLKSTNLGLHLVLRENGSTITVFYLSWKIRTFYFE